MRFKSNMPYSPPKFPPIYGPYGFNGSIHDLVNVIKASATATFDVDLAHTFVTNVSHWRNPTSEHELVTVTYKVGNSGEHTKRHLGLERFRLQTNNKGSAIPESLAKLSGSFDSSSSLAEFDSAVISDELQGEKSDTAQTAIMSSEYELVRSFDLPTCTLSVLKAVSMAAALATTCGPYSYLEHMCWLWAALYMLLVQVELDGQPVAETKGKLWSHAGKSKRFKVRLVDPTTGRLLVDNFSASNEQLQNWLNHIYKSRGDQALVNARQDAEKYRTLAPKVVDIEQAATLYYSQLYSSITSTCEDLRDKERQREQEIRNEAEKKTAELQLRHDIRLREIKEREDRKDELYRLVAQRDAESRAAEKLEAAAREKTLKEAHAADKREAAAREEALKEELRVLREQLQAQLSAPLATI